MFPCADCEFYQPLDKRSLRDVRKDGLCRRNPPQIINIHDLARTYFPEVQKRDGCGEWQSGVDKATDANSIV